MKSKSKLIIWFLLALVFSAVSQADELTRNTTPAERRRGAVFAENFENAGHVIGNGGAVGVGVNVNSGYASFSGAGTAYIEYQSDVIGINSLGSNFSILVWMRTNTTNNSSLLGCFGAAPDQGVRINTRADGTIWFQLGNTSSGYVGLTPSTNYNDGEWHLVVGVYNGTNRIIYYDDTDINTSAIAFIMDTGFNFKIGKTEIESYTGDLRGVRLFRRVLTQQEVHDYYRNSIYNYRNKAVVDLPMLMAQHDAVNGKTLDVSGNGNDADFGVGAVEPTKLTARGYSFDGGDHMVVDYDVFSTCSGSNGCTVSMLVNLSNNANKYLLESTQDANNGMVVEVVANNDIRWHVKEGGTDYTAPKIDSINTDQFHTLIFTYNGVDESLSYLDGYAATAGAAASSLDTSDPNKLYIGSDAAAANNILGDILGFKIIPEVLTPIQVFNEHIDMMKKINDQ